MEFVLSELMEYVGPWLEQLQWEYIIGFILMSYVYEHLEKHLNWQFLATVRKRIKIAIIGLSYGIAFYHTSGLAPNDIPGLGISFVFTFGFHKLLIDTFISEIQKRIPILKPTGGGFLNKLLDKFNKKA